MNIGGDNMSKRSETIELESALIKDTQIKRLYGCEEITIGFYNGGHGNEIVDFMTMDSKGVIKCYELKVTLQDLKSTAKKSWYGHYNYLVVSSELYSSISDWNEYVPAHVGIIIGKPAKQGLRYLESSRKAKKCEVDTETVIMLKESMVRSMYWKMVKYKDSQSLDLQKKLQAKIRTAEKERDRYYERAVQAENIIDEYETYKALNDGIEDFNLGVLAKEEHNKFREKHRREEATTCHF